MRSNCVLYVQANYFQVDFIKLQHALVGLYIWELLCGSWFDIQLLRRQRQGSALIAKWVPVFSASHSDGTPLTPPQVYLACRYTPLPAFIVFIIGFDVNSEVSLFATASPLTLNIKLNP